MSSRSRFNPAENSYTLSFSIFFLHRTLLSPQLYSSSLLRSRSYQSELAGREVFPIAYFIEFTNQAVTMEFSDFHCCRRIGSVGLFVSSFPALQSTKWRVVVLLMMHRRLLSDAYNGGWCSYWQRSFCNDHGCRAVQSLLYLKFTAAQQSIVYVDKVDKSPKRYSEAYFSK
ncbi:uncharacterized protein LOC111398667 isoform X2 [Olea europaea var. sylvestris]|uniref:uncharacterized protein LOC111398667 isoform X2 n=1 Tax=Olea europaea var. sylvestris TaxID=158386 RepID=UPI000C1D283E|nr:uncharacterized protein LOC111398667 isoform X2 [Olea europaea var. sylvestris]